MRFTRAPLDGAMIIDLDAHTDERGAFARTFCEDEYAAAGLPTRFPQCNLSYNPTEGTLRGIHFNVEPHSEAKLVRCVRGSIYDVIVDLRAGSVTQFDWMAIELTADNGRALFVPAGFGHGFITLEDTTDVHYRMSDIYRPDAARGLRWDDPALSIEWPREPTVISSADAYRPDLDVDSFDPASYGG